MSDNMKAIEAKGHDMLRYLAREKVTGENAMKAANCAWHIYHDLVAGIVSDVLEEHTKKGNKPSVTCILIAMRRVEREIADAFKDD